MISLDIVQQSRVAAVNHTEGTDPRNTHTRIEVFGSRTLAATPVGLARAGALAAASGPSRRPCRYCTR